MEAIKLEVGDLVWDSWAELFGIILELHYNDSNTKITDVKVGWDIKYFSWEKSLSFKIDKEKKIPCVDVVPF